MKPLALALLFTACNEPLVVEPLGGAPALGARAALGGGGGRALVCGDGFVSTNEQCDDGNKTNGDGCSSTCRVETRAICTGSPSTCVRVECGDGVLAPGEQCDDGNTTANDGCDASCHIEAQSFCTRASPSVCTSFASFGFNYLFMSDNVDGNFNNVSIADGVGQSAWKNLGSTSGDAAQATGDSQFIFGQFGAEPHDVMRDLFSKNMTVTSSDSGWSYVENGAYEIILAFRHAPAHAPGGGNETLLGNLASPFTAKGFDVLLKSDDSTTWTLVGNGTTTITNYQSALVPNAGKLTILDLHSDGAGHFTITKDCTTTETSTVGTLTSGSAAATVTIGNLGGVGSGNGNEDWLVIASKNAELSAGNRTAVCAAIQAAYPNPTNRIVAVGDSNTAVGLFASGLAPFGQPYPSRANSYVGKRYGNTYAVYNLGLSGDTAAGVKSRGEATLLGNGPWMQILMIGTNDITTNSATASATWTTISAWATEFLGDNASNKLCLMTVIPFGSSGRYTAPKETQRAALNALILAHSGITATTYDISSAVSDGASPPAIATAYNGSGEAATTGDGVHLGQGGFAFVTPKIMSNCFGL